MSEDEGMEELVTEEMLWDRIPEVQGEERANTYYELSARIFARGQYDEALALARTCDLELAVKRTEALWASGAMPAQRPLI